MNNNNNNESAKEKVRASSPSRATTTSAPPLPSLLEILEDMLRNRISQKKKEIHKTQRSSIADTEKLWTQIETLRWVLSQSLNIRRRFGESEEERRYYY
jgi:hypothetical protein